MHPQSIWATSLPEDKITKFLWNMDKFLQTTRCHTAKDFFIVSTVTISNLTTGTNFTPPWILQFQSYHNMIPLQKRKTFSFLGKYILLNVRTIQLRKLLTWNQRTTENISLVTSNVLMQQNETVHAWVFSNGMSSGWYGSGIWGNYRLQKCTKKKIHK